MEERAKGRYAARSRVGGEPERVVSAIWAEIRKRFGDLPANPPEGRWQLRQGVARLDACVAPQATAFRWEYVTQDKTPRLVLNEAFCLCPASFACRAGVTVQVSDLAGQPAADGVRPEGLWQRLTAGGLPLQDDPDSARNPSFDEITGCLEQPAATVNAAPVEHEELVAARSDAVHYRNLAEQQADALRSLGGKYRAVLAHLAQRPDEPESAPSTRYESLAELPVWAAENSDRIQFAPRAFGGAKKSLYEDPAAVYAALEFLAGPYRLVRLGKAPRGTVEQGLAEIGMKLGHSAGATTLTNGDYVVHWNRRRRELDMHLLKGGGRDERTCLRIYFFWDENAGKVVVGWLPSHLDNSLT